MSVTIREVSKRCGLSVSAVSKALNNYPDVSAQTRARVLATAQQMGYYPNALARGLKTNRTYNLGVILVDEMRDSLMHTFFIVVLNAFRREAERLGYDITLINHNIGNTPRTYLDHCRQRNVDGVCLMCVDFYDDEIVAMARDTLPLVTIDHPFGGRDCVLSDNRIGMRALLGYAIERGHRRIAFVHGTPSGVTSARLDAFQDVMREQGIQPPPGYVRPSHYHSTRHAAQEVSALLALPQRPTCILMTDDYSALSGISAIQAAGLRIPNDISVAGYDGVAMIQKIRPQLTTFRQNGEGIGLRAAQRLIARIENPGEPVPAPDIVAGTLLCGETVAAVAGGQPPLAAD
ncbi:MAG: LacI family transcriptional regulator [Oscillospiraceae bacterium]|jgi:LacI family transcriptional regulator|nr:LacI family transcriptional regulator [Oscillospiraceae bacterium]